MSDRRKLQIGSSPRFENEMIARLERLEKHSRYRLKQLEETLRLR
jgi:hypothetical protein